MQGFTRSSRDCRIDFIRGIAICMVLIDHIEDHLGVFIIRNWTLVALGISDAAEVFMFLSGYVFGLVYTRRLNREGFVSCQLRVLWRTLQIYLVYQITFALVFLAALVSARLSRDIGLGEDQPLSDLYQRALILRCQPYGFSILATYIMILPLMPILLWTLVKSWQIALTLSLALYIMTQITPGLFWRVSPGNMEADFNPSAWQFLFFCGMAVQGIKLQLRSCIHYVLLVSAAIVLISGLLVIKVLPWLQESGTTGLRFLEQVGDIVRSWSGKPRLEPIRILHFICLVYVGKTLLKQVASFEQFSQQSIFTTVGQHSLLTYSLGLLILFCCAPLYASIGIPPTILTVLIDLNSCAVVILFAYFLQLCSNAIERRLESHRANAAHSG